MGRERKGEVNMYYFGKKKGKRNENYILRNEVARSIQKVIYVDAE